MKKLTDSVDSIDISPSPEFGSTMFRRKYKVCIAAAGPDALPDAESTE